MNNIGFVCCIVLVPIFGTIGILFAVLKEKSVKLISGFNSFSKKEQDLYDKNYLARDMRNQCFSWAGIMLIGALASLLWTYCAIAAYIVWGIFFFKEVHFDAHKAFKKYLLK